MKAMCLKDLSKTGNWALAVSYIWARLLALLMLTLCCDTLQVPDVRQYMQRRTCKVVLCKSRSAVDAQACMPCQAEQRNGAR